MSGLLAIILIILFSLISAGVAGFFAYNRGREVGVEGEKRRMQELGQSAEERAHHILAEAETNIKQQQLALKEQEVQMHNEVESELNRRRKEIDRIESRLQDRQESIDKRFEQIENRERKLNQRQSREVAVTNIAVVVVRVAGNGSQRVSTHKPIERQRAQLHGVFADLTQVREARQPGVIRHYLSQRSASIVNDGAFIIVFLDTTAAGDGSHKGLVQRVERGT